MAAVKDLICMRAISKHSLAIEEAAIAHLGPEYVRHDPQLGYHTILDACIWGAQANPYIMVDMDVFWEMNS